MKALIVSIVIRMLASTWTLRVHGRLPSVALVSSSKDGALLSKLLTDWGYSVVLGSSSRGGKEALEQLVSEASSKVVLITPDGPRGPNQQAKPGAIVAAQRAHVPVVLVRMQPSRSFVLSRSWDKFQIPSVFASVNLYVDHPWSIPEHATRDEIDALIIEMNTRMEELIPNS
jgi:lysophospholipid acyltransferase (LPLAT)-like uncharacterized protein